MKPEQFCYWMQGFAELSGDTPPTPEQWKSIREHLALVFEKVTPPVIPAQQTGERRIEDAIRDMEREAGRRADEAFRRAWPSVGSPFRKPDIIC